MSSEEQVKAEPCAGTFNGCLVEGDTERHARERKIKRRAIAISVALQTAGLAALVIAPLFAKTAELTERIAVQIPPYSHHPAHQLLRSGRVELHAVITTDGSVQSLDVVSGDPLFVNSALEAVRQWHYKPTYLNGQPVEIDTYITVIYTLQ